ncbi:TPA: hypothetical protein ACTUT5_000224 [Legionella anisa]|uniref:Uncharacterized protein n=1 Tax=Legionella anisa TaxID=28082 RepID=A0AAX0WWM3_9GAMM|nr:hypothetical protein [Legionella anisa]AWN73385.1 hypothetical protein DLD14_05755 [Legionella anisa]MBN5934169.1 hypothetical protein [Legionella anisa]MCW8426249.1 hypothetical protein [Legionella anisa]MCW8447911.1 hypothetical protein [Legionella anisa]PNL62707.1 hypothetical protein A6J39_016655 [Legionella anisa]
MIIYLVLCFHLDQTKYHCFTNWQNRFIKAQAKIQKESIGKDIPALPSFFLVIKPFLLELNSLI